jgi:polyisoprenoid-binding protein YceI
MNLRTACLTAAALAIMLAAPAPAAAQGGGTWVVDPVHSQVDFRVKHLVGRVRGTFSDWYAVIEAGDKDWQRGVVRVSVQTRTLDTGNAYRDADLRATPFFAVDSFPQMTFLGTGFVTPDSTVRLEGTLTIKGHARPVVLTGQRLGTVTDSEGHTRIGFEASTTLDRRDYGMDWTPPVGGANVVGNEVEITISIEAVRIK